MGIYDKVLSVYGLLRNSISLRATRNELAPNFSTGRTYTVGRLVVYDGKIYRCSTEHYGAWNAAHFSQVTIDDAISMISSSGGGITGVKLNGNSLTPVSGVVDVEAITGVQFNGSDLVKTSGKANVEAIAGVQLNGVDLTKTSGKVNVEAVDNITLNSGSTGVTKSGGTVNIQAVRGITLNNSSSGVTTNNGIVNLSISSGGVVQFKNIDSTGNIFPGSVNIIDCSSIPAYEYYIQDSDNARQFILTFKDIPSNDSWVYSFIDNKTSNAAVVKYYNNWGGDTMQDFVVSKWQSGASISFKFAEMEPGVFTTFDMY